MSVKCLICGHEGLDITIHLRRVHSMSTQNYKDECGGQVVCPSVSEKRKETTLELHGDSNWRNEDARKLMYSSYEGCHPLKDPTVRKKAEETKLLKYSDPHYTNMEQRVQTNMGKYGVPHSCMAKDVITKRVDTLNKRYGKVFNCTTKQKSTVRDVDAFKEDFELGMSYDGLVRKYGKTEPIIRRWVKDLGLHRTLISKSKKYLGASDIVLEYLEKCFEEDKVMSFYEYGVLRGSNHMNRMKRLFNDGKKYHHLKEELFNVAENKDDYREFLGHFK